MKKITLLLALALSVNAFAQEDKTVTLVVSGQGKTQDEAKQNALRSAIEQAFGAFISSKTEILNDQIVSDQITSVTNGNIQSFSILNESQLPDNSWGVTLKALVSVNKLTSFVESKGITIEIKGGLFALNIKQQLLNEQGEIKAVSEMVGLLHEPMQIAFDYTIKSGDPKSVDAESKNWEIPLVVKAITNNNIDFCANYCIKTLAALSLSSEEVSNYQSLNKAVFPIAINYNGSINKFYLRKEISINILKTYASNWEFYTRLFTVQSGIDESYGIGEKEFLYEFKKETVEGGGDYDEDGKYRKHIIALNLNFLSIGREAGIFTWNDKRTLSQIEQMSGYNIKPSGVVSQFKYGGFVVYEPFTGGYRIGINYDSNGIVNGLTNGFPALLSGIMLGDKVININKTKNTSIEQISTAISKGEEVSLEIIRNGKQSTIVIKPIYIKPYKGLIAAIIDFSDNDWDNAKKVCDELILNGYNDWYLPSIYELETLSYFYQMGIGNLTNSDYWSSTEFNKLPYENHVLIWDFYQKQEKPKNKGYNYNDPSPTNYRAVRSF
jgi:hypothetical protein